MEESSSSRWLLVPVKLLPKLRGGVDHPEISDASFPYLPYSFLTTLHSNYLSYLSLKTFDFNMHWKSVWHESGRESLLEKIRSCWWLFLPCWYKSFHNQPVSRAVCCHIPQSVHRWPVLPTSGVRFVQFGLIACSTVLAESTQEYVKERQACKQNARLKFCLWSVLLLALLLNLYWPEAPCSEVPPNKRLKIELLFTLCLHKRELCSIIKCT